MYSRCVASVVTISVFLVFWWRTGGTRSTPTDKKDVHVGSLVQVLDEQGYTCERRRHLIKEPDRFLHKYVLHCRRHLTPPAGAHEIAKPTSLLWASCWPGVYLGVFLASSGILAVSCCTHSGGSNSRGTLTTCQRTQSITHTVLRVLILLGGGSAETNNRAEGGRPHSCTKRIHRRQRLCGRLPIPHLAPPVQR